MRYRSVVSTLLLVSAAASARSPVPQVTRLTAELRGGGEVPGSGDPDGSGLFSATIDRASRQMCYTLEVRDIATPTLANIHVGDRVSSSIVVQPLTAPAGGRSEGCVIVPKRTARHLMLIPQEYYVNVHNAEFPNGAVRGQLLK